MKLIIGCSRKIGQPNYGSEGASCGLELELDQSSLDNPTALAERIRAAYQIVQRAVEDQLERAAEPPEADDLGPGDPAHDRRQLPPAGPPRRQPDRQPDRPQRDRAGYGSEGDLPVNARQLAGWLNHEPQYKRRVEELIRAWNLPRLYRNFNDDDVRAVVRELLDNPAEQRSWPGAAQAGGNGRRH